MESQQDNDTSDDHLFLKLDLFQNTINSLRKLLSDERLTPGQISSISKVILALGSSPGTNPAINVFLDLDNCQINIEKGDLINIAHGGVIDGDSFTDIDITFYTFTELFEKDLLKLFDWEAIFQNIVKDWSDIDLIDNSDDLKINWDALPAIANLDDDSGK